MQETGAGRHYRAFRQDHPVIRQKGARASWQEVPGTAAIRTELPDAANTLPLGLDWLRVCD